MVLTVAKPGAVTKLTGPLFTVESDRFRIDLSASDGTKQGHHQLRPYWIRYFLKQSFYQTFARLGLSRHTYAFLCAELVQSFGFWHEELDVILSKAEDCFHVVTGQLYKAGFHCLDIKNHNTVA